MWRECGPAAPSQNVKELLAASGRTPICSLAQTPGLGVGGFTPIPASILTRSLIFEQIRGCMEQEHVSDLDRHHLKEEELCLPPCEMGASFRRVEGGL